MKKQLVACLAIFGCFASTTAAAEYACNDIKQEHHQQALSQEGGFRFASLFEENNPSGPYAGILGGVNFLSDINRYEGRAAQYRAGYLLGIKGGYQFGCYRLEGESAYRNNSIKLGNDSHRFYRIYPYEKTFSLMLNGYWDINLDCCIKPYVGLGLGYSWSKTGFTSIKYNVTFTTSGVAWQAMLGGTYGLTDCIKLNGEYRYFNNGNENHQALIFGTAYIF
jgi:opacity protein-like surface antigen